MLAPEKMFLPGDVKKIISALNSQGFQGYAVGGCVRDFLMNIPPHDYDITTNAKPEQVKRLFSHTVDTGIQHGTVTVILNKTNYEVTTYRIDGEYKDGRHPESVEFAGELKDDLSRRDFTINAVAYNEKDGYVDLFGGIEDIKHRLIRGVGDPDKRFKEDALRMMRAIRFSAQLDFRIEPETYKAIKANSALIKNVSIERIREEFFRLIMTRHCGSLSLLTDSGMTEYFLPELKPLIDSGTVVTGDLSDLNASPPLRLAYIFGSLGAKQVKEILTRLRFDNKTIKNTVVLTQNRQFELKETEESVRRLISVAGELSEELLYYICTLRKLGGDIYFSLFKKIKNRGDCCALKDLAVNGSDLSELGIKGKKTGEMLSFLLDAVLKDPLMNDRETLISLAKEGL